MGSDADSQGKSSDRSGSTDERQLSVADDEKTPAAGVPVGPASLAPSQESRGRSSASYASASPHEIPEASKVAVHLDEPAVVVAADTECETLGRVDDELTNPRGSLNAVAVAVPVAEDGSDATEGVTPVPAPPFPGPRDAGPGSMRLRTPTVVITRPSRAGATWVAKAGAFGAMLLLVTAIGGFMITRADANAHNEEEPPGPPPVRVVAVTPPPEVQTAVVSPAVPAPIASVPAAASQDAGAALPQSAPNAPAAAAKPAKVAPRAAASE